MATAPQRRHPGHSTRPPRRPGSRAAVSSPRAGSRRRSASARSPLLIALAAVGLYRRPSSSGLTALPVPFSIPWPIAALAFYLGETNVVEVHFLRERHSFSLSELPGIVGLFVLPPTEYLVACLLGTGLALLADRQQSSLKRAFNLAQFGLAAVVALCVFHAIATPAMPPGPQEWLAAFAAAGATSALEATLVATAISLSGGASQFRQLPADAELQRDGRDGQREPGDARGHGRLGRSALDRPARRPDRRRVRRLSRLHRRAREARAAGAPVRVESAAPLRARSSTRPSEPCSTMPGGCSGRSGPISCCSPIRSSTPPCAARPARPTVPRRWSR